jgi:hypothetical protein
VHTKTCITTWLTCCFNVNATSVPVIDSSYRVRENTHDINDDTVAFELDINLKNTKDNAIVSHGENQEASASHSSVFLVLYL